jgi:hypothetical protein
VLQHQSLEWIGGLENMLNAKSAASGSSVPVAKYYNVSPKAIRDIWNHITWKNVTRQVWPKQDEVSNDHRIKSVLGDIDHQVSCAGFGA